MGPPNAYRRRVGCIADAGNHAGQFIQSRPSSSLEHQTKKASDKFSDTLHVIANEPSLAFFRVQEHVRKSLPQLVAKKHDVQELHQQVQGACFDMEYATKAVAGMERSRPHFISIQDQLKNSMFIKQQLKYEQSRRQQQRSQPSMYRAMLRTQTVDLSSNADFHRRSADLTNSARLNTNSSEEGSPRARSSSMSSYTFVGPASLLR